MFDTAESPSSGLPGQPAHFVEVSEGPSAGSRRGRPQRAPRPRHWKRAASENLLSNFIPFSSMVSPHDVITRGGDYLRVWRLDGVAFECADEHTIVDRHEAKCSLLRNLAGGQFAIWEHRLHRHIDDRLQEPQEPGFARDLARAYAQSMQRHRLMSNELYLTLLYRPTTSKVARAMQASRRTRAEIAEGHAEAMRVMEEKTALIERVMRAYGPTLLGTEDRRGQSYSEVAEFLGYLVNGVWRPVPVHAGPLYRTLPVSRLSFGLDKLEIRHGDERRFAALVDIQEYADAVQPGVLNALLYEPSEFIETHSFSILPRRDAMRALERQRDQLIASEDVVQSQIADMDVALNELGDGQFCMGEYHYSLVMLGTSAKDAGQRAAQAIGAIGESSSIQMRPVDLVADAAWFAQWPGNWTWRPRQAQLSSRPTPRCRPATISPAASATATPGARR
jgi:type IV secretion system protein VirB4